MRRSPADQEDNELNVSQWRNRGLPLFIDGNKKPAGGGFF